MKRLLWGMAAAACAAAAGGVQAPVVFWASDPVGPGEVVAVQGGNWGAQPKVELFLSEKKDRSVMLAPLQNDGESLKFLIPADWKPDVFRFTVCAEGGKSEPVALNAPDVWWQQGDCGKEASPGGWLRVFGKCLSFGGKASVRLSGADGKARTLEPSQQECWSLTVALPENLPAGDYRVSVHNGHKGQAAWREAGSLRIAPHAPAWKADVFDVTRFGAIASDGMDDTVAVQAALDAAGTNGGGTVSIPCGRFQMNDPIRIPRFVLLKGAGRELSQLYWRDTAEPFESLIYGASSFGIEELTIMAGNHRYGIKADTEEGPDAGNIVLRRVHLHLNRFDQLQTTQALRRFLPMPWEHAISLKGGNLQVIGCEIFSSRSPFLVSGDYVVVRGNRFFEGDCSHVIGGDRVIFEDNVIEGGPVARGGGDYASRMYYARNTVGMTPLADGEGFTTDGGGNAPVTLVACEGKRMTFGNAVDWNRWTHNGKRLARVCIMEGEGAGQSRLIVSRDGKNVELDRPWLLPPGTNSVLHVIPDSFCQNLIVGNRFHDITMFQSYAWAIDWVLSKNHFTRAGGIHIFTHPGDPAWYMQCLENEIEVGNAYRSFNNSQPPCDAAIAVNSSQARGQVLRRNVLHNNAQITVNGSARNVLVERNEIRDVGTGIRAGGRQTLVRGNRFTRVGEPVWSNDDVYRQPADRIVEELSAVRGELPPGCGDALARLEKLALLDPQEPGFSNEVRACVLHLVRQAASVPGKDYSPEFLRAVYGVRLTPFLPDNQRPGLPLDGFAGRGNLWLPLSTPAYAMPAKLSLVFPAGAGYRVAALKDIPLVPGVEKGYSIGVWVDAGVLGPFSVPFQWSVEGEGWRFGGTGRMRVGNEWTGSITQWALCGPFPNGLRNELEAAAVHGPERRLDVSARYPTLLGERGWQTAVTQKVDFAACFGAQPSAVAYAVAVLRAKKPTPVMVTFVVAGHNVLEPSLNGQPWRVPNHYGRSFSRTLLPGDNILMAKLANVDERWTLEARVRMADTAEAGDVCLVPAAELASVAALNPPPRAPIPQGKGLPFADGLDWRLVYEDDFDRTRLGTDWGFGPDDWDRHPFEFGNGVIQAGVQMHSYLTYARKVAMPFRVEYDVKATGSCASGVRLTRAQDVVGRSDGFQIGVSRGGVSVTRDGKKIAQSTGVPGPPPDVWHHVTVQAVPPEIKVYLDGKPALTCRVETWPAEADTFSFSGDAWNRPQIDNVRLYSAAP